MTQEEKQLLLKDLCARLPYGIVVSIPYPTLIIGEEPKKLDIPLISIDLSDNTCTVGDLYGKTSGLKMFNRKGELLCKPYLRPMSSMTEDEKDELYDWGWEVNGDDICSGASTDANNIYQTYQKDLHDAQWLINWLNTHHFDFRGLIEKSLAIVAPEGMYKNE